jgi:5-methylcytosine-specific restriction endonuclease McrA
MRAYQATRKEIYRVRNRKWASDNPGKMRTFMRKYRSRNLEACRQRCRDTYAKNKAKYKQKKSLSNRLRYQAKRAEIQAKQLEWRIRNRVAINFNSAKRRALKKKASVNLAGLKEFVRSVKSKRFATCYYCQKQISSLQIHFDHIVPLSKGGEHSARNLCTSCPNCNLSKHDKSIEVWITSGQQLMRL